MFDSEIYVVISSSYFYLPQISDPFCSGCPILQYLFEEDVHLKISLKSAVFNRGLKLIKGSV